jgi:FkbM family methyltransferase
MPYLQPGYQKEWTVFRPEVELYPVLLEKRTSVVPTNVFELGSHNGDDAEYLRQSFGLNPNDVFCFEPNPHTFKELTEKHPGFNSFDMGLSNYNGTAEFNCVMNDTGVSSTRTKIHLKNPTVEKTEVNIVRMDYIIDHYNIKNIDVCKIDVEGCVYEVLEGFGDKLSIVKTLQIESEISPLFSGQKLFPDVAQYLTNRGYHMISFFSLGIQCDTFWVRNDLFTIN